MGDLQPTGEPRMIGRYALYKEIAAGGMATVHLGRVVGAGGFSRPVAIKRLHAQFARDPSFVAMFLDEARLASRIFHPNVVAPLDVVSMDGELFLVMEYVRGASLSRLLRTAIAEEKLVPPRIVGAIFSGVLHGLHAAHEARGDHNEVLDIVHRDVSPQNILVGIDGVARVLDFGVAKAAGRMQTTRDGQLKGKLAYMAPEQVRGETVSRRTDIYAATVVLWEALTSRRLFKADNEANALARVLSGNVPPPSTVVPGLPDGIDAVVARGLHLDASQRYASAREMAAKVEATLGVAPPTEVADWVEHCADADLSEQAQSIVEMERSGSNSSWSLKAMRSLPQAMREPLSTDEPATRVATPQVRVEDPRSGVSSVSVSQTAAPPAPVASRSKILIAGIAAAAFVIGTVAIAFTIGRQSSHEGASHDAPVTAPPPPTQLSSVPRETSQAAPPPTGTIKKDDVPTISVSALPKTVVTTAPVAQPQPPRRDCNPPYTTDAKGHVHFKPECM
jgi:serine/threonine protein kinase